MNKRIIMRGFLMVMLLAAVSIVNAQQKSFEVKLYPGGAPDTNGLTGEELWDDMGRVSNVTEATLTIFLPDTSHATGQMVIICPGGGYRRLSFINEGTFVAEWLNSIGVAAAVLKYRMPNGHHEIPLKDVHAAFEYVNSNAEKLGIRTDQVGIMGFSAGGHLAACASNLYTSEMNKPDFAILIYPVITLAAEDNQSNTKKFLLMGNNDPELIKRYSSEQTASEATPPTFISLCADDKQVDPHNSILYFETLNKYRVPVELHIYPSGGHAWKKDFRYWEEVQYNLGRWLSDQRNSK